MKIYFYINTLNDGGAERVIANLASGLSERGHHVAVITSFKTEKEYLTGSAVHRYVLERVNGTEDSLIRKNIRRVRQLRKIIKRDKPDLLISAMAEANFRALIACNGLKTKTLISICNDPDKEYEKRIYHVLARTLYKMANGAVFQTKEAQRWFPRKIQQHSRIIWNPVNQHFFQTDICKERHDIVAVGRLTEQKNFELLINAFHTIADLFDDNLLIYGEGELRGKLEAMIEKYHLKERIYLKGWTKNIIDVMKSAKLFVLSSDYEGMPNALMEAMALGLPCIATDCPCGGPRELIKNGQSGMLVSPGNVGEMASAIKNLLSQPEKALRIGNCAKEASEKYEPQRICSQWESYIRSIVELNKA